MITFVTHEDGSRHLDTCSIYCAKRHCANECGRDNSHGSRYCYECAKTK